MVSHFSVTPTKIATEGINSSNSPNNTIINIATLIMVEII